MQRDPLASRIRLGVAAAVVLVITVAAATILPAMHWSASAATRRTAVRRSMWRTVFADGFSQSIPFGGFPSMASGQWGAYENGTPDTSGTGVYMPSSVVSESGGLLNMHLHSQGQRHLVAAIFPKIHGAHLGYGFLYGRVSVRMRADYMPGYKLAILLWPDSEVWPRDGEIDFPEADLNGYLDGYMHRQGAVSGTDSSGFWTHVSPTSWHTVTVVWLRRSVTFLIDGHAIGRSYTRVPSTPMHLVIQAETSTTGHPPSTGTSGNVQLNWVAISTPACNPRMSIRPAIAACAG